MYIESHTYLNEVKIFLLKCAEFSVFISASIQFRLYMEEYTFVNVVVILYHDLILNVTLVYFCGEMVSISCCCFYFNCNLKQDRNNIFRQYP